MRCASMCSSRRSRHDTRQSKAAKPTVTILAAIAKAYHDAMAEDPKVITLGEDLADPEGGGIIENHQGIVECLWR
jgi:hypothetical protein